MIGIRTILFAVAFVLGCGMALSNPIWGIVNYLFVYQLDPTDRWWGAPIKELGVRFSLIAAICTLIGMFAGTRHLPKIRPVLAYWELGALGLLFIAVCNIPLGVGFGKVAQVELEKFWKVILFTLVLTRVAAVRQNLMVVIWTLVIGSLCVGYDAITAPPWAFVQGRLELIGGPDFSSTSGAAAHLTSMLPIIGLAFLISKTWKGRALALVAGGLSANAVIMCRTRSAFIGLVIGAIVAVLAAPRAKRFRIHVLLILGAFAGYCLTDEHYWDRMATLTDEETLQNDRATMSRKEIWLASAHIVADHPFGIGVGNFPKTIGNYDPRNYKRSTHNSLVVCFAELGITGGLIFLGMVTGSTVLLWRCARFSHQSAAPLETSILAYGLLVSLVTCSITALGTQRFYCESFWWILAMPLCLKRVVDGERVLTVEEPSPVEDLTDMEYAGALCAG
ncbi:MAG: O-antigen ligase family protein [Planctomycetes bacterium]|nr:O-antigen ligase family protein [Planctomycetota bacterium]MBI3834498.1 O-antigen ligase family protein [Planctomycetota bacterium]